MTAASVKFDSPRVIAPEDQARADYYALLASLFFRAPDERLLQSIAIAEPPEGALGPAWLALAEASAVVPADAVNEEYATVFVGVGRPPIMLFGSYYLAGFMMEKPLAALRDDLAKMGFSRAANTFESEDHVAALCDVMRAMILGDMATKPFGTDDQHRFYSIHIKPWIFQCIKEISEYHQTNYYKRVAAFAQTFFEVESDAFQIES